MFTRQVDACVWLDINQQSWLSQPWDKNTMKKCLQSTHIIHLPCCVDGCWFTLTFDSIQGQSELRATTSTLVVVGTYEGKGWWVDMKHFFQLLKPIADFLEECCLFCRVYKRPITHHSSSSSILFGKYALTYKITLIHISNKAQFFMFIRLQNHMGLKKSFK